MANRTRTLRTLATVPGVALLLGTAAACADASDDHAKLFPASAKLRFSGRA
jgi:hypothetical protein